MTISEHLNFAIGLAIRTGNLLSKFYDPAGIHSSAKPDQTVVTEADLAADKFMTEAIMHNYPHDEIVSEESSHFLTESGSPTWIIDPLDGTTNFSLGLAIWGVSIARVVNGLTELGVINFPRINELYTTSRRGGAYLNQTLIATRPPDPAQPMSFFACCSRSFRNFDIKIPYKPRIMGSSAYTFCLVARGSALLGLDVTPKIWDLAAVWLLIEEAGGTIATIEGSSPFPPLSNIDYSLASYPTLAAANSKVYESGRSKIIRK